MGLKFRVMRRGLYTCVCLAFTVLALSAVVDSEEDAVTMLDEDYTVSMLQEDHTPESAKEVDENTKKAVEHIDEEAKKDKDGITIAFENAKKQQQASDKKRDAAKKDVLDNAAKEKKVLVAKAEKEHEKQ